MSFFAKFPTIYYAIKDSENPQLLTNVVRRIALRKEIIDVSTFFADYTVKDGETPEIIADKLYDNPGLHWLVLLANEIVDPYSDWVMSSLEFDKYLAKKYVGLTCYVSGTEGGSRLSSIFVYGNTIDNGANISTILEYNPTYGAAIVTDFANPIPTEYTVRKNGAGLDTANVEKIVPTLYGLHHFEIDGAGADPNFGPTTVNGIRQASGTPLLASYRIAAGNTQYTVTNYDYESKKNEDKRKIKLLRPEYVQVVINELQLALTGNL